MRKLTRDDFSKISKIEGVNPKKDIIQNMMIEEWWKTKNGLIESYTGSGKSVMISKLVKRINREYPDYNILIVSPTSKLEDDFNKKIQEFDLKNTTSITTKSCAIRIKNNGELNVDVLIIDEAHRVGNEASEFYSQIIPNSNYKFLLCCSATFEYNHIKYFESLNVHLLFKFSLEDGYKLGLVPDYTTYCLGINLTENEKIAYSKIQKEYDNYVAFFSQYDPTNPIGAIMSVVQKKGKKINYEKLYLTSEQHAKRIGETLEMKPGIIIGIGMKWLGCVNRRTTFLNNSENLFKGALHILKNIVKDQILVFAPNKEQAKTLQAQLLNSAYYFSGISEKKLKQIFSDFENEITKYLISVKALDEGIDIPHLRLGLQYSYSSKKTQFGQRSGRTNRYDPDDLSKQSFFICLYVEDFEIDGIKIISQQKKWLQNSLKGRNFVVWCKSINEIKL